MSVIIIVETNEKSKIRRGTKEITPELRNTASFFKPPVIRRPWLNDTPAQRNHSNFFYRDPDVAERSCY